MDLSNLKPAAGSVKKSKRVGRGQGSGKGGTSARGHKGAQSRSGYKRKVGFEGGQMPLQRRTPKRGFKNPNRVEYTAMNLDQLQYYVEKHNLTTVDTETLKKLGIIAPTAKIKILGRGEMTTKINAKVDAISASAKEAIEKLGGSVELV